MSFLPTANPLSFAAVAESFRLSHPGACDEILDRCVQAIWSEWFYATPLGHDPEEFIGWRPLVLAPHPAGDPTLSPQPQPISRIDVLNQLVAVDGLPRAEAIRFLIRRAREVQKPSPPFRHDTPPIKELLVVLTATAWRDYPPAGRNLIGRIILPHYHLEELCRRGGFNVPQSVLLRLGRRENIEPAKAVRGRPQKHADLYLAEFHRRLASDQVSSNATQESDYLWRWLKADLKAAGLPHGDRDLPSAKTIRNKMLALYDFTSRRPKNADTA